MTSASFAIALAVRSCCIARGISLFELATTTPEMGEGGVYNASISGLVAPAISRPWVRLQQFSAGISGGSYKRIMALDALTATALLVWPLNPVLLFLAAGMLVIQLNRQYMSCDGADEMVLVVLTASLVGSLSGAFGAAAWFLAGELCLSYLVAGSYKAASPVWKRGQALKQIVRTNAFGNAGAASLLSTRPGLASGLQLVTVAWECTFVLSLFAPMPAVWVLMALGAGFHFACAWVMGLNSFPWAFMACYPAVIYANTQIRAVLGPELSPAATLAAAVSIAVLQVVFFLRSNEHRSLQS